jgi:hypothetical protein
VKGNFHAPFLGGWGWQQSPATRRIMSQRYPVNHTFDPDIIRLMIPLNCALAVIKYEIS